MKEANSAELNSTIAEHGQDRLGPILILPRLSGYSLSSGSTSPTTHSRDESNSAYPEDLGSLVLTPLELVAQYQERLYDLRPTVAEHDSWERSSDFSIPIRPSSFKYQPGNTSTTLPPISYTLRYNDPIDSLPSRLFHGSAQLPSITHEGRVLSLGRGHAYNSTDDEGSPALLVNRLQASRASLRPVQSLESTPSLLDQPFQASLPEHQLQEPLESPSFKVLVGASGLARITDNKVVDRTGSVEGLFARDPFT
jgi:hypothetical protein